jgi:hypothetical protein
VLLVLAGRAPAQQTQPYTIKGFVWDRNFNDLAGVKVTIKITHYLNHNPTTFYESATTDAQGNWTYIDNVDPDLCDICDAQVTNLELTGYSFYRGGAGSEPNPPPGDVPTGLSQMTKN